MKYAADVTTAVVSDHDPWIHSPAPETETVATGAAAEKESDLPRQMVTEVAL